MILHKPAYSFVFPVKLLQLLPDIQHFKQLHTVANCLAYLEMFLGTRAFSYGKCLCVSVLTHHSWAGHKVRSEVKCGPRCLNGSDLISSTGKRLVWLLRLDTERRESEWSKEWIKKIKVHFEVSPSGYLRAPHSQTGVACNDTIVSRWQWQTRGSVQSLFSQGLFIVYIAHIELTNLHHYKTFSFVDQTKWTSTSESTEDNVVQILTSKKRTNTTLWENSV